MMNKLQLERYTSGLEMDNDSLAYLLLKAKQLIVLQTICEFNVWWMHDISPLVMKDATIDFLVDNKDHFKRKINVGEFMEFDCIIYHKRPETFKEFKQLVKTSNLGFKSSYNRQLVAN